MGILGLLFLEMSAKLDGRTKRKLRSPSIAVRQFTGDNLKVLSPVQKYTSHHTIIPFFLIVIGGTLLMIGTFTNNNIFYWVGVAFLALTGFYLITSTVNSKESVLPTVICQSKC